MVSPRGTPGGLSRRLAQTLLLIAQGLTLEEIAVVLDVTEEAIKSHVKRLRELLGARNRPHIVWIAVQRGLLVPPPQGSMIGSQATTRAHRDGYELAASRLPADYRAALTSRYGRPPTFESP